MKKLNKSSQAHFTKNFIFGVEDSLVSTVGLLSGIASAGLPRSEIFLAGIVLIFVEAFSMGVGSFLSEGFVEDLTDIHFPNQSLLGGIVMLLSYFTAGFIPLAPYLSLPVAQAFPLSIALSLVSLLLLGVISALVFHVNPVKHGLRMFLIGGGAVIIGVLVGKTVHT